jgi:hypothetical protein
MKKALLLFLFALPAVFAMAQSTKIDATVLLRASGTNSRFLVTDGSGNVTWVQGSSLLTAGTGISISGNTITNSAPDQTVSLTGAGATAVTGTYPSFTITTNALATIQDEGSGLTQRATLNFIGGAVSAADNAGSSRTDISFDAEVNGIAALSGHRLGRANGGGYFCQPLYRHHCVRCRLEFWPGQRRRRQRQPDAVDFHRAIRLETIGAGGHDRQHHPERQPNHRRGEHHDRRPGAGQIPNHGSENGVYITGTGAWTRSTDFDASTEMSNGGAFFVEEGTANNESMWVLTTDGSITVGTTTLTFQRIGRANQATAGSYGSATQIPVFTLNSDGTISSVTNTTLTESQTLTAGDGRVRTAPSTSRAVAA